MFAFVLVFFVGLARAGVFGLLWVLLFVRFCRFWRWDYPVLFPPNSPQKIPLSNTLTNPKMTEAISLFRSFL